MATKLAAAATAPRPAAAAASRNPGAAPPARRPVPPPQANAPQPQQQRALAAAPIAAQRLPPQPQQQQQQALALVPQAQMHQSMVPADPQYVAYAPGPQGADDGAESGDAEKAPLYEVLAYVPPPPAVTQFGAAALFRRKLSQPFDAFVEWFSRQYKGAAANWITEPPGYKMPTNVDDPLPVNPMVHIAGEWRQNPFGKYYRVTIKVMNRRAIHQPCRGDPSKDIYLPGMEEFQLDRMPVVVKRASVGPNPGYIFQQIVDDGMPVSNAPGHEIPWTQEPRRRYGMAAAFDKEAKLFDRILEELAAFIVRQGKDCVIPSIQNDIVKHGYSPTKAYLELIAHMRQHMPFVEHPPTRSMSNGVWQDDPNSASPNMPEISAHCDMTENINAKKKGPAFSMEDRKAALRACNYSSMKKMAVAWAHQFFKENGAKKYKRFPVSRAELRVDVQDGRADVVSVPMTDEEMLTLIHTNAVAVTRVRPTLKLLSKPNPDRPERLFKIEIELCAVTYLGTVNDVGFQVRGYVPTRSEIQRVTRVQLDDDVAFAIGEMRNYKPQVSNDDEMQRYLRDAPDIPTEDLDLMVATHLAAKYAAEAQAAAAAAAASNGDPRLHEAADAANARAIAAQDELRIAQEAAEKKRAEAARQSGSGGATVEEMPIDDDDGGAGDNADLLDADDGGAAAAAEEPLAPVAAAAAAVVDPDVRALQTIANGLHAASDRKIAPVQQPPAAPVVSNKRPAPEDEVPEGSQPDVADADPEAAPDQVGDTQQPDALPLPDKAAFQDSAENANGGGDNDDDDEEEEDAPIEAPRPRLASTPVRSAPAAPVAPSAPLKPAKRSRVHA